ncbi:unnamed protein product [Linum trigynum]|uniref:Uncharacterized protein n=1 Tax=Linum trigynum TaxID=586398 RepID=A0AAV2F9F5_9ROSI
MAVGGRGLERQPRGAAGGRRLTWEEQQLRRAQGLCACSRRTMLNVNLGDKVEFEGGWNDSNPWTLVDEKR